MNFRSTFDSIDNLLQAPISNFPFRIEEELLQFIILIIFFRMENPPLSFSKNLHFFPNGQKAEWKWKKKIIWRCKNTRGKFTTKRESMKNQSTQTEKSRLSVSRAMQCCVVNARHNRSWMIKELIRTFCLYSKEPDNNAIYFFFCFCCNGFVVEMHFFSRLAVVVVVVVWAANLTVNRSNRVCCWSGVVAVSLAFC